MSCIDVESQVRLSTVGLSTDVTDVFGAFVKFNVLSEITRGSEGLVTAVVGTREGPIK
jgi:hypothetical protein